MKSAAILEIGTYTGTVPIPVDGKLCLFPPNVALGGCPFEQWTTSTGNQCGTIQDRQP